MVRTGLFKYVIYELVDEHHKAGWMIVSDLFCHHGFYAVLMWKCDC
jgi:hypothetical protein